MCVFWRSRACECFCIFRIGPSLWNAVAGGERGKITHSTATRYAKKVNIRIAKKLVGKECSQLKV